MKCTFPGLFFFLLLMPVLPSLQAEVPLNLIAEPTEKVYKDVDGVKLKLFMFAPAHHKEGNRTPAVVCIHGGGWSGGSPELVFPYARYFASRGMVAFCISYRLTNLTGVTPGDCIEDCKSAFRFIRKNAGILGVDTDRIAILGGSAGGHLAACLGVMEGIFEAPGEELSISSMANAMIIYNPVMDLTSDNLLRLLPENRPLKGFPGLTREEIAKKLSPIFYVKPGQPPAMLMHGIDDTTVAPSQGKRFAEAMQKAGNRCDLHMLPKTKHAFMYVNGSGADEQVLTAILTADEFLVSLGYLKGKPTLVKRK
ncbi:MAG: alpha/beta hydrolase [Candidatus Latescibacterota bacterium]